MKRSSALCFSVALANTLALAGCTAEPVPTALPQVDKIVVDKSRRRMTLIGRQRIVRSYRISLGASPVGTKERRGDNRTPEGRYVIVGRNPKSAFHLSLRLSYPTPTDIERARRAGSDPGGDIMIHGTPNWLGPLGAALKGSDWTAGCIAVANDDIEEIWNLVADGTPIEIRP